MSKIENINNREEISTLSIRINEIQKKRFKKLVDIEKITQNELIKKMLTNYENEYKGKTHKIIHLEKISKDENKFIAKKWVFAGELLFDFKHEQQVSGIDRNCRYKKHVTRIYIINEDCYITHQIVSPILYSWEVSSFDFVNIRACKMICNKYTRQELIDNIGHLCLSLSDKNKLAIEVSPCEKLEI